MRYENDPVIQLAQIRTREIKATKPRFSASAFVRSIMVAITILALIVGSLGLLILLASGSSDPVEATVKLYLVGGLAVSFWAMR